MKKTYLLTMVLGFVFSMSAIAQKAEQLKNSFNYLRAVEIIQNKGDHNEALEYLQKEIDEHPKNGYAYSLIAGLYLNNNQPGDAIEPLNKAVSLLKKDKDWNTFVYRQRAKLNLQLGNEQAALNDWLLAIKVNPKDINIYSDRAEFYYQRDMYKESDADFEKICQLQPGNTLGYMGKGRNFLETGKFNEAIELFSYSIKLDPSSSQAYAFRAESYIKQGLVSESLDDIITALSIDSNSKAYNLMMIIGDPEINTLISKLKVQQIKLPNNNIWPFYLGDVYAGLSKYLKAIEAYKESNEIEPSDITYARIADCYNELGNYELALDNINQAMEMDPNDYSYVSTKADLLYEMGQCKEAIKTYDNFIKAYPDYWAGYYRRAFFKDNVNDVDGAIEDYSTAIVLNPNYAYSYLGRADKYLLKGNKEAAMKDYQMVVALDTVFNEANCVQYALLALGEVEKAKSVQYAILAKSASAGNYYDAACLFARMGEKETALNFLRNSLEKGFTRFSHIKRDDDLNAIRNMPGFKSLITEYEEKYRKGIEVKKVSSDLADKGQEYICEIPMVKEGGTYNIKCKINDLPLYFVFDTGASDVSLSMVEASFMMKNGYLSKDDVIGSTYFSDAVGNVNVGTVINLRKVQFGDLELNNVRASVVKNQKAPLLLGQTVLSRLGKFEIDNKNKVIRFVYRKKKSSSQNTLEKNLERRNKVFETPIIKQDDLVVEEK